MTLPRVLLVVDSLQPGKGGISRVARLMALVLTEWQAAGRLETEAVTLSDTDPPADLKMPVWPARGSRFQFSLAALKRGRRCTQVIFDAAPLAQLGAIPPLRRRPSLSFIHGIEVWERAAPKYIRSAHRLQNMLANSAFTRTKADKLYGGFARARVCWLATEADSPARHPTPMAQRAPSALIVGRLVGDRPKGHRELIACWPAVNRVVPQAQLHIVGSGPFRDELEKLAGVSEARTNIIFHGFANDQELEAHYGRARLLVMPSRGEGFGLVYIEAMRHGLPVIASQHDAAGEVIVHNETGLLVDQDRPPQLEEALIRLLKDTETAGRMGEAGQARWQEHFCYRAFRERFGRELARFLGSP